MHAITGSSVEREALLAGANEWSITRGARSGRVAWQFIQDLAGQLGKPLMAEPVATAEPAQRKRR